MTAPYLVARFGGAHNVLRLQVQMHDLAAVHVLHALADLAHEDHAVLLGERKVVRDHALEQLAAGDVLHHHDDLLRQLEGGEQPQQLRMLQALHDRRLLPDALLVLQPDALDLLGREHGARLALPGNHLVHHAEPSLAHLLHHLELLVKVTAGSDRQRRGTRLLCP